MIIPCHSVVKSNGGLGGYFGNGHAGLKKKVMSLEKEGIKITNRRVDMKKYFVQAYKSIVQ